MAPLSLEELFHRAVALPPGERAAFLREHCGGDAALAARVAALCAQDERGTHGPLAGDASRLLDATAARLGNYTIVRELGAGGMGAVFLAQQEQPVQRLVAIKRIAGPVDELGAQRFEVERQALALMAHPCIAALFDGGTTPDGQPYLVMEYVEGRPLTEYCDQRRLDWRQRVQLLRRVCNAVQHAHQRGVVHRDLKPANVLVTEASGQPLPKVIDFGIARILTLLPRADGAAIGSPGYMSPEQADPRGRSIDSRADIYALGALLHELLIGAPPPATAGAASANATAPTMAAELQALPPAALLAVAEARATTPAALQRLVRGDLHWIAQRALAADANDRYAAASELEADLRRCLVDEVVLAAPAGLGYRVAKFARRHRTAVAFSGALLATIALAFVAVTAAMFDAAHARDDAVVERDGALRQLDKARGVEDFFEVLLFHADPALPVNGQLGLRELLDRALPTVDRMFGERGLAEAAVRRLVGHAYDRLAEPFVAQAQLQRAWSLAGGGGTADRLDQFLTLARLLQVTRTADGPAATDDRVEPLLRMTSGVLRSGDAALRAAIDGLVAQVAEPSPDGPRCVAQLARVVACYRAAPRHRDDLRVVGITLAEIGLLLQSRARLPEAVDFLERAEELVREVQVEDVRLLPQLRLLGSRWLLLGQFAQALRVADELVRDLAAAGLREHWLASEAQRIRAAALIGLGRHAEAEAVLLALRERFDAQSGLAWLRGRQSTKWSAAVCKALDEQGRLRAFVQDSWQRWRAGRDARWWLADTDVAAPLHEVAAALVGSESASDLRVQAVHAALLLRTQREAEAYPLLVRCAAAPAIAREPELLADLALAGLRTARGRDALAARERLQALAAEPDLDAALRTRCERALARLRAESL